MNPKHLILTLLLMLCPIGMAAQSTITRNKPKPAVTKPKPAAKPKAKPAPRRNSSTTGLSAELNKLINNMVYVSGALLSWEVMTVLTKCLPTASPSVATISASMR